MINMTSQEQLLLSFGIPLLAAALAAIIKNNNLRDGVTIALGLVLFANTMNILDKFFFEKISFSYDAIELIPGSLKIAFEIEPLGMIFAVILSFLWVITTIYSIGYMRKNNESHLCRFACFFAIAIFAAFGIAFAKNMFTLFLFYEILTLGTFPLVTHSGTAEAKKAGRVYLGTLMGTSVLFLLPAFLITLNTAGTLDFTMGGVFGPEVDNTLIAILLFLYVFGIGKAALMPVHRWLPAAMVAPTPVSALLHAVAVVKAGVFTVVKVIIYIFGVERLNSMIGENWWHGGWLLYISGFTVIAASAIAVFQDNLKKRLAYSTISQLSYVILAAAILSPKGIIAAVFHIVAHAFGKITLFFAAGSIYTASHKKKVSELSGIGKKMPLTMTAFAIGALSMIGIPPMAGFISKWNMFVGAFGQELYFVMFVLFVSTVLNACYFMPIIYKAFFEKEKAVTGIMIKRKHGEAPLPILIALTATAACTVLLFIYPDIFLGLANSLTQTNGAVDVK